MPEWKYVLDRSAFEFFQSTRGRDRRKLYSAFHSRQEYPMQRGQGQGKDEFGRDLEVVQFERFLIYYWVDIVVKEVRLIEIERA